MISFQSELVSKRGYREGFGLLWMHGGGIALLWRLVSIPCFSAQRCVALCDVEVSILDEGAIQDLTSTTCYSSDTVLAVTFIVRECDCWALE